jgi:hypothetical protein
MTNSNRVDDVVGKFRSKYGEGEVKKYYTKFDGKRKILMIL